jgi:hypothetical protein
MIFDLSAQPALRPLEPVPGDREGTIGVRDPSGLASVALSLTEPAFFILTLLDGSRSLTEVQNIFLQRYSQPLADATLLDLVARLDESLLLEGDRFNQHYAALVLNYRAAPSRPMRNAEDLGILDWADSLFDRALADAPTMEEDGRIVGLIAPHLDYPRGEPCYGKAYRALRESGPADRYVILGTNHFGLNSQYGPVATGLDFSTPLGTTRTDRAFIERLEERCGDLRQGEYDHVAEHSVELQVCWLQHIFGAGNFQIVPVLCPDPCGPTGTQPYNGKGVDLADFAAALRETMAEDDRSTTVIAGADFSHVGPFFGDDLPLGEPFLNQVRLRDELALERIESGDAEAFRQCVADGNNPTRICSAGCMYTLLAALPDARPTILGYHQAVVEAAQNCVTCAAVTLRR